MHSHRAQPRSSRAPDGKGALPLLSGSGAALRSTFGKVGLGQVLAGYVDWWGGASVRYLDLELYDVLLRGVCDAGG